MSAKSVTQQLTLHVSVNGAEFELTATFSYCTSDPHEIRMEFGLSQAEPIVWQFDRNLLAEGLHGQAGAGAVQTRLSDDRQHLVIQLVTGHTAALTVAAVSIACFLEATYSLIAPGNEPGRDDIDAGIAGILAEGAR